MTDKRERESPEQKIENLELNAETIQDLTSGEAEGVHGGQAAQSMMNTKICGATACYRICE